MNSRVVNRWEPAEPGGAITWYLCLVDTQKVTIKKREISQEYVLRLPYTAQMLQRRAEWTDDLPKETTNGG